jgi:hypothetical protein
MQVKYHKVMYITSFALNISCEPKKCDEVLVRVFTCLVLSCVLYSRVLVVMYETGTAHGKTRCPLCACKVWKWDIKGHLKIHDSGNSSTQTPQNNIVHCLESLSPENTAYDQSPDYPSPHQFQESTSLAWDTTSCESNDSMDNDTCLSNCEEDNFAGDDGLNDADMFGDEMDITVDSYISTLSDKYDPNKVLKYLSWSPRPLTVVEQESIRFLRNLSFGAGMSRAHSQAWLDYTRDLGGVLSFCFQ